MSETAELEPSSVAGVLGDALKRVKASGREKPTMSKSDVVLKKLRSAKGVTVAALMDATGWQPHSVRGFLSGTVRKKLGLNLVSEIGKDDVRRYRIADAAADQKP